MASEAREDRLAALEAKVARGERLDFEDGVALLTSHDLLRVGRMADAACRAKVGGKVFFVRNRHINYSNVCGNRCDFCAFSRSEGEEGAFVLSREEVLEKAGSVGGVTEFHIVGGEDPHFTYEQAHALLTDLRAAAPGVTLTAFTASEIAHFADAGGRSVSEVLRGLQQAGLGSMPGGGAEVFSQRVRDLVCPRKVTAEQWLDVHRQAHRLGIPSNATMLYGHVETVEERVDHLLRLRELQDETGGFQAFIPLAFHPANTRLSHLPGPTGVEDLKLVAVARLLLDNFTHIKAYWVMLGIKLAQIALYFGADDLDGTIVEEVITHMAGGTTQQAVSVEELVRLIRMAGRIPVERDTFYRELHVHGGAG